MEDLKAPGEKTQRKQKVHKPTKQKCVDRDVSVCDRSVRIILNNIIFKGKVDC